MKIGIVADTHSNELPKKMLDDFKDVDLIIHAGDFCTINDYNTFKKIKEVKAVYGNMDDQDIRKLFPRKQIFEIEGCRIGLFHGQGAPQDLLAVVQDEFKDEDLQIIIFGHSHDPMNEKIKDTLYFNPGSPNDMVFAPYCSYGIVTIQNKTINAEIIKIK